MMASRKRPTTRSNVGFFLTNKKTVDSEMEGKKTKDNDGDEEATAKSQKLNSSRYRKKFNAQWLNDYSCNLCNELARKRLLRRLS